MKQARALFLFVVLFFSCSVLSACGLKTPKYELISATFAESEYNQTWVYVDNALSEQYISNRGGFRFYFDLLLKDKNGKEAIGKIDIYESTESAVAVIDGERITNYYVDIAVAEFDVSAVADEVPVTVTISSNPDSFIYAGECEVTVPIEVVHVLKSAKLAYGEEYDNNYLQYAELDLTGLYLDCTYEDDSTEVIPFVEVLEMPRFKSAGLTDFSTETVGMHQSCRITYPTTTSGSSTISLYYNVLPDATVWEQKTTGQFSYWIKDGMVVGSLTAKGTTFTTVSIPDSNVNLKMTYQGGYLILYPNAATFETAINNKNNTALNALIPSGYTASVTSSETLKNYYRIAYDLIDGDGQKMSANTMFLVHSGSSTSNENVIPVTVENSERLTSQELATVSEFVALVWFL